MLDYKYKLLKCPFNLQSNNLYRYIKWWLFQLVTLRARFIFKDSNIFYKLVMHSVLFFLREFISRILYYKQYSEIFLLKGNTCFIQLSMSHIAVRLYKYILAVSLYYEVYFYYKWHSIARTLISRRSWSLEVNSQSRFFSRFNHPNQCAIVIIRNRINTVQYIVLFTHKMMKAWKIIFRLTPT